MKILQWDGDGFVLYAKRLERGSFHLPKTAEGRIEFSSRELARGKILFSRSGETASAR